MKGNSEFEALFDYFTQKCEHEAKQDNRDEYVQTLIDIEDVIREYLERRAEKDTSPVSDSTQLSKFFSNKLTNMYDDVASFPPFFRRNIISAVTSLARESRTKNDIDSYRTYMDLLLYYYDSDICLEDIHPDLKRFFISRYTRCVSASIDDVLNSESMESFQNAEDIWNEMFESVSDILKTAVEKTDTASYSEITDSMDPAPRHSQYSVAHNSERGRDDSGLLSEKKRFVKDIESERVALFFALTGWAYHLLNDSELIEEDYQSLERETIDTRRNISQISKIYYKYMNDSKMEGIPYWDSWDMAKQREKSIGTTMTRSSSTSWLRAFYCIELLRVGKERSFDAGSFNFDGNPLPVVQSIVGSAEKIESKLEKVLQDEDNFPISRYGVNLDSLASAIVQLHKEAEEKFRELSRERVHEATLDPKKVADFKQSMIEKFVKGCTLRNLLIDIGTIDQDQFGDFSDYDLTALQVPRQAFVSTDAIPLLDPPDRYMNTLYSRFSGFILEQCGFYRESANTHEEVLDYIREYTDSTEVRAILHSSAYVNRLFDGVDEYEYALGPEQRTFEEQSGIFNGSPVIRSQSEEFTVLLLFDISDVIVEKGGTPPLSITFSPREEWYSYEEFQVLDSDEISNVRDWLHSNVVYECQFEKKPVMGVRIMLDSDD